MASPRAELQATPIGSQHPGQVPVPARGLLDVPLPVHGTRHRASTSVSVRGPSFRTVLAPYNAALSLPPLSRTANPSSSHPRFCLPRSLPSFPLAQSSNCCPRRQMAW